MTTPPHDAGLHVIVSGGTIDFELRPTMEIGTATVDTLVPRRESIVPYFFARQIKFPAAEITFDRVALKDSREFGPEDQVKLRDAIKRGPHNQVLVTHGIVGLEKNADYLRAQDLGGKVVGMVGSRMPLDSYRSDGGFQLGYAWGKMQSAGPGVHTYHPDKTRAEVSDLLENVVFLITGGTIDSGYSPSADTAEPFEHTRIPDYFRDSLGIVPSEPNLTFREICMRDSRRLTDENIRKLVEEARNHKHKPHIVTAGTYALPDLGALFQRQVWTPEHPTTSLFVGAMIPDDVRLNDGWFNLGLALGKLDALKPSTYVGMHGWLTHPDNVMKQLQEARFNLYDPNLRV
ncbi:MAG: asparaginase domain-containing protein [Nanoarchaeota archaeon]|nr:asparaginase domain-containing protein [Nanoarchaeota archaeon]